MCDFDKTPEDVQYGKKEICGVQKNIVTNNIQIPYDGANYTVVCCGVCEEKKRAYVKVNPSNEKVELIIIDEIEDEKNKLRLLNFEKIINKLNNNNKTYAADLTGSTI